MTKKLKFALVGFGRIGERHAEHINNFGELIAVCDINETKMLKAKNIFNTNVYNTITDLLLTEKETDVVSVCTPNGLHAEHTIQSFKNGCHVLCEKPMAIRVSDCGEMIKEAEKANKRLFIVKQNRFNPPVSALKEIIDNERLGKISNIQLNCFWNRDQKYYNDSDWKGRKLLDGGILYTQFSHFIDLIYWLFGDVKSAKSILKNFNHPKIEFEDTGVSILEFYNGIIGTINFTINSFKKNMEGSLTVFGDKGTVKIGGQYLNVLEYQNIEGFKIEDLPAGNTANNYGEYMGSMSNHDQVYRNVVDVLTNQGIIATNGFEGLKTVEIIDKIYNSKY